MKYKQLVMALMGEHCLAFGDSVTKQPHLSPQHYELNDRQHVLDRTRVSVSKRCSKAMKKQQAWGKSLRRLNRH